MPEGLKQLALKVKMRKLCKSWKETRVGCRFPISFSFFHAVLLEIQICSSRFLSVPDGCLGWPQLSGKQKAFNKVVLSPLGGARLSPRSQRDRGQYGLHRLCTAVSPTQLGNSDSSIQLLSLMLLGGRLCLHRTCWLVFGTAPKHCSEPALNTWVTPTPQFLPMLNNWFLLADLSKPFLYITIPSLLCKRLRHITRPKSTVPLTVTWPWSGISLWCVMSEM